MNKKSVLFIGLLLLVCIVLSFALYVIKLEGTCNIPTPSSNAELKNDFSSVNNLISLEVNDFSEKKLNLVDINAKSYQKNTISITDSDFKLSDSLYQQMDYLLKEYGAGTAFYIVSLEDGMTIGYNVDQTFETASSIKAPYALYLYHEIADGNINPNQKIMYEPKYYNQGTGVVKTSEFGTEYTVKELVYYSLTESDNVAHIMLHHTFGVDGYNQMLTNLGAKSLYLTISNPWGFLTPRSMALVWQDIYNFAIQREEGIAFFNILSNGKYNYFKEVMPSIPSASKAGFASHDVVEAGIVFGDHPYIAVAVANKGGTRGAYTQVLKMLSTMNDIMNEYHSYVYS